MPAPTEPAKPCFEFRRSGTCKFGRRCRYSHNVGGRQGHVAQPRHSPGGGPHGPNKPQHGRDGKLREWKRLLEQGSQFSRPSPSVVCRFFQLGLDLMDGDVGAAQEAINLLVSENGLSFIKDVSDRHILEADKGRSGVSFWDTEVKPLFQLITHPRVVDSAVLEQEVAAIFNFLLGVGGSRMTRLFSFITSLIQSWPTSSETTPSRMAVMELSLAVLSKILDCNTANIVSDNFSKLATRFSEFLNQASKPEEEFSHSQASKYLDYIRQRLEIGDDIPTFQNSTLSIIRESFVLRRDLPGHLSAEGPRHDNDHAKITEIKILPTYEEIMSPRGEYLPTTDPSQWHIQGIRGRLDREFRLLREDTVGQLRDAIRETFELIKNQCDGHSRRSRNGARTYIYDFVTPVDVKFDRSAGLELMVRCNQPSAAQNLSLKKRTDWWIQCKRLQAGALVCVLDETGSVLFCVVSDSTMRSKDDKPAYQNSKTNEALGGDVEIPESLTLSDDPSFLYCKLQLAHAGRSEVSHSLRGYRGGRSSLRRYLVEFPGVLLASFEHTLAALQHMYEKPQIPFSNLIAPTVNPSTEPEMGLPQYARKAGFTFDLKCLTHDKTELAISPQRPRDPEELASRSDLDLTQSAALLSTLSTELSLIQGPPGTGKSYTGEKIIKVLLENKRKAHLGPILCVCYTNHALDQLLVHLLDDGIKSIIRIGSRSKSEKLQNFNLRSLVKGFDRTKSEKSSLFHVEENLREVVRQTNDLLKELSGSESWRAIKSFLATTYPRQQEELFGRDEDGWETVIHQPEKIIDRWLIGGSHSKTQPRQLDALKQTQLSSMSYAERRTVHRHWLKSIRDPIISKIGKLHNEYTKAIEQRNRVRGDVDLRCLQQADIVGVTTTGLARNIDLLRKLHCKVMLCEEAGEVLEAHILTALLPTVEHCILVGDHLQLRPQIQNYELQSTNPRGEQYSLDLSLFERLVRPPHATDLRLPFTTLETQRRMHPSISELIRSTLYPSLKDAEAVMKYPKVVGMKEHLFWFHHEQLEAAAASQDPLNTSHSNNFEIEMTTALVSHLVRQGEYSQGDIAVLTPYLGQLHKLRRRMESMFEICLSDRDLEDLEALEADGLETNPKPRPPVNKITLLRSVRVATVDNFQGEEAKVIVISLVRSNPQDRCGFLGTSNRINVLLSRAQHGMYIIGNSNTYKNVPIQGATLARDSSSSVPDIQIRHFSSPNRTTFSNFPPRVDAAYHATRDSIVATLVLEDVTQMSYTMQSSAWRTVHGLRRAAIIPAPFDAESLVKKGVRSSWGIYTLPLHAVTSSLQRNAGRHKRLPRSVACDVSHAPSRAAITKSTFHVTRMSLPQNIVALPSAAIPALAATVARVLVPCATLEQMAKSRSRTTASAN
ncbi:hypothetical protein EMPG_12257 [Blastomyces silverae]|uniref:C3H1-type domain-containing protein n=1 Tax=Blastomyces silverae TaxID=2060906 RepID=A0A0H1BN07_9EURO|nr:hypothetical protein EMPG_12257 [Blastomyces silverae]